MFHRITPKSPSGRVHRSVCVSLTIFPDVGMMMMQSGMVKQNLNTYQDSDDGTNKTRAINTDVSHNVHSLVR